MSHGAESVSKRVLARQLCLFDEHNLSDAEAAFADEYITTRSPADAYIKAKGPGTKRNCAYKMGQQWLRKDHIRAYIEQRQKEAALEAGLTQEEVIAYLRTVTLIGLGRAKVRRSRLDKSGAPVKDQDGHHIADELYEPSLSAANSAAQGLAKFLGVGGELDGDERPPQRIEVAFVAATKPHDDDRRQDS